uniref:Uncharacterized protein n=1 Tax=Manihot esculenta TaxID=3983 RepID=A0A2C9WCA1_MANES
MMPPCFAVTMTSPLLWSPLSSHRLNFIDSVCIDCISFQISHSIILI